VGLDVSDHNSTNNAEARVVLWPNVDYTVGDMQQSSACSSAIRRQTNLVMMNCSRCIVEDRTDKVKMKL